MKKLLGRFAVITAMFVLIFMNGKAAVKAETITKDISPDIDVSDSMSAGEQVNLYKVKVEERGYQIIEFKPDTTRKKNTATGEDHHGWNIKVYDREKKTFFEIDGVKKNFTSNKFKFAEGTELLVEVSCKNSNYYPDNISYKIKVNTVASTAYEVEDNDSASAATEIFQESPITGNLIISKDEDYFVYKFKQDGVISVNFEIPDFDEDEVNNGWNISIYNKKEKLISEYKKVKNDIDLKELPFKKGEKIYIRISSNEKESSLSPERVDYKLTLSYENDSKWEMEYNNTLKTANKLNGSMTGMLMNAGDADVYYFNAVKSKDYEVKIDTGDNADKEYKVSIFIKNKKKETVSENIITGNTSFSIKANKGNKIWVKIQANDKMNPPVGIKYVINYK